MSDSKDLQLVRVACAEHLQEVHFDEVSIFGSSEQRAALSRRLQQDASVLIELSSDYKKRANALLPIARLPLEVLLHTFSLVAKMQPPHLTIRPYESDYADLLPDDVDDCLEREGNLQPLTPTLGWIALSHVAKSWRHLCLSTPSLWSRNIGRLPRSIPAFLERIGNDVPLEICVRRALQAIDETSVVSPVIFDIISSERIQAIDWSSHDGTDARVVLDDICTRSLPLLKRLTLNFSVYKDDDVQLGPNAMLSSCTLTALSLVQLWIPFAAPNLTRLSIMLVDYTNGVSGVEMLRVLSSCPLLRTVELHDFEIIDPEETKLTHVHATLNHVDALLLEIRNQARVYDSLLDHITLPPSVQLGLWPEPAIDEDIALLARVMHLAWRHELCTTLKLDGCSSSINFYTNLDTYRRGHSRSYIVRCGFPAYLPRVLPGLNLHTYFKDITSLCISASDTTFDTAPYESMFEVLPNVTHLRVLAGYRNARVEDNTPTGLILQALRSKRGAITLPRLEEVALAPDINMASIRLDQDVIGSLIERVVHRGAPVLARLDLACFEFPTNYHIFTRVALETTVKEVRWKGQIPT